MDAFWVAGGVTLLGARAVVGGMWMESGKEVPLPPQAKMEAGFTAEEARTVRIFKGRGCNTCNNTGYKGRTGLYEGLEIDDEIRELILVGASAVELKKKGMERGMLTLRRRGLIKIKDGVTTLAEVARETIH